MRLISVAVPVPFLDALTYNVPESFPLPLIGARVLVPLGSRTVSGCVVEHAPNGLAGAEVKDIVDVVDDEPMLPAARMTSPLD